MKLAVFGLSISSSWGNGHATLWRGLSRALARHDVRVVFFEKDVPFYAAHRDLTELPGGELILYPSFESIRGLAERHVAEADAAIVTSYCPDAKEAAALVCGSNVRMKVFYDLDTPMTLERISRGEAVEYLPDGGLGAFDRVLSFTGGASLRELERRVGARAAFALYGSVDPEQHRPAEPRSEFTADVSYLGTYAEDRQLTLERLFLAPARRLLRKKFLLGGAQYPAHFPWGPNVFFVRHVQPTDHPAFYSSSPITVNVTRGPMASVGFCPSGRLFEAAACGVPVLSDTWPGLDLFFEPGREILLARNEEEAMAAFSLPREQLARFGRAARKRALAEHTADRRALELLRLLDAAPSRKRVGG